MTRRCPGAALAAALLAAGAAAASAQADGAAREAVEALRGEGPGPRVAAIEFEGVDPAGLRAYVEIKEGDRISGRDLREAVRALHASARFAGVAVWLEPLTGAQLPEGWTDGVRVIFALAPVRKLVAVSFPGRQALPESILHQTADLQVNAEFLPSQLPRAVEAIRAAYQRVGHRHATVTPVPLERPDGVALELRVEEGPATRVEDLHFQGTLGLPEEELKAAFKLVEGDVLNLTLLDDSVRGLRDRYRRAARLKARVGEPQVTELDPSRARVVVPVDAGPQVRFYVRGNRSYPDSLLVSRLAADGSEETLDEQRAQELAGRLQRFYVQQGFFRAKVAARAVPARDGALDLVFSIDEGALLEVEEVLFDGNRNLRTEQLRERLRLQLLDNVVRDPALGADGGELRNLGVGGRPVLPLPERTKTDPETVFEPVLYSRALKQIEDLYKSQGYLWAQVGPPRLEALGPPAPEPAPRGAGAKARWKRPDPVRVRVVIPVKEGDRAVVSRLLLEGGAEVPTAQLDAALTLRTGGSFSYLAAEEGRAALTQVFTRRGHLYAKVEDEELFPEPQPGEESGVQRVEVRYRIQPGPVVRVGYVEVVGHRRTLEQLIRDLVDLKPGDVITPERLDAGQQALLRTGLFFSATLTPRNPEVAEPEKTVQVVLRERPTLELQASGGFSLADGPRATVQWTQGNLGGRNLTFTALAKANFPIFRYTKPSCISVRPDGSPLAPGEPPLCTQQLILPSDPVERVIDLGLSVPRLWPFTNALRVGADLIHERAVRSSYELTKYSVQLASDLNQRRPWTFGVAYEVGYQIVNKGQRSLEDFQQGLDAVSRLADGGFVFSSLRPTLTIDLRDDPGRPRAGVFAQVGGDWLRSLTDASADSFVNVNLIKLQGMVAAYLPLPFLSSIVAWGRAGRIFLVDPASKTPGDRRFYLGGSLNLRGFNEDALQPQDVRQALRDKVQACQDLLSGVACTEQVKLVQAGATSDGGLQLLTLGVELRVPVASAVELAVFYEAGNLWVTPVSFLDFKNSVFVLRDAAGVGLRWATPIGRMAIDLGVNLDPDPLLGEKRFGFYFAVNVL